MKPQPLKLIASLIALGLTTSGHALTTLNSTYTGWYDNSGLHGSANPNYAAGLFYHDFFVFDLSTVPSGTVIGATLQVFNPTDGYSSANPSQSFDVGSVSTPISTLVASAVGAASIFADLSAGTLYGSQSVSAADSGQWVNISLNSGFRTTIEPLLGSGQIALGGYLGEPDYAYIFAASNEGTPANLILEVTAVPEPSTLALAAFGAASLLAYRRRLL